MSRYINPFPQYINISGSPNNGGLLKFFDTLTDDPKNVYNSSEFIPPNDIGNEVRLSASGSVPPIFLNGAYKVTLTDPQGNEIDSADPIGVDSVINPFDEWQPGVTYNEPDITKGSNDLYYMSMVDDNLGNDPTDVASAFWEQINFLPLWNTVQTYFKGQLAIDTIDSRVYQSQQGNNQGVQPSQNTAGDFWKILLQKDDPIETADIKINKIDSGTANVDYLNDDILRWRWLFDTNESLNLERYDAGGLLLNKVLAFDNITGDTSIDGNFTVTDGAVTFSQEITPLEFFLSSDAAQTSTVALQDAGITRWEIGQNQSNNFSLVSYDAAGLNPQPIWSIVDGTNDLAIVFGNLQFGETNKGIEAVYLNGIGGAVTFNFPALDTNTEDTAFNYFDNTNTTGTRFINVYRGDGTADITCQIDAEDGSIHTALDRAAVGEPGVKLGKITLSTLAPTGGEDGDLWLRHA